MLLTDKCACSTLIAGSFILGALLSAVLVWQLLPSEWNLPFWTTLKASVDAEKYGHPVEHYAEQVVLLMTFAAMVGGAICSAAIAFSTKLLRKPAHP
jgi:hypothetical protein